MGINAVLTEQLKSVKALSDEDLVSITRYGVHTGSTAWGVGGSQSDQDWIITKEEFSQMNFNPEHFVFTMKEEYEDGVFQSIYCKSKNGIVINLLVMRDHNYKNQYVFATEVLSLFVQLSALHRLRLRDKTYRVKLFTQLKEIYSNI